MADKDTNLKENNNPDEILEDMCIEEPPYLEPMTAKDIISGILKDMSCQKHSETLFRDEVISQLLSILISDKKPNALLVGPAGSGKTQIVEALADKIAANDARIPSLLKGYRVYSLSLSDIVSGCCLMGELEEKVQNLIEYMEDDENKAILFIDEIHMLFAGETYKKVAQILKPALSRGKIRVIGATTTQEVKHIDADPAFNRRFSRVLVDELSKEQTCEVIERVLPKKASYYKVNLDRTGMDIRALSKLIVGTADEFCLAGSHRPDNALTLLDRTLADAVVARGRSRKKIRLSKELIEKTAYRITTGNSEPKRFDESGFKQAVSYIKGQDPIITDLCRVMKLYDMHIRPRNRPLTFLFAGPSGVGKTEITKILSGRYVGEKPIILNMAEFNSPSSINRIIGAPVGYVGSDSSRELPFDVLDTNPYKVILLDEFEKCDRAVQRLFMSVFDEGTMQTNLGKTIDFSKTIIIATTNAGCTKKTGTIGFMEHESSGNLSVSELAEFFDVELINRFNHIHTFNNISRDVYEEILGDIYKSEVSKLRLDGYENTHSIPRELSNKEIKHLADKSYQPQLGARPAATVVTEYIDNMLIEMSGRLKVEEKPRISGRKLAFYHEYEEKGLA